MLEFSEWYVLWLEFTWGAILLSLKVTYGTLCLLVLAVCFSILFDALIERKSK